MYLASVIFCWSATMAGELMLMLATFLYTVLQMNKTTLAVKSVLRIRDVYPGSRIRMFSIPDPGSASKNLSILNQKLFLSSRKYDPDHSSRIRTGIQDPDFLPIPDPEVKKAPDPGSRSATLGQTFPTKRVVSDQNLRQQLFNKNVKEHF